MRITTLFLEKCCKKYEKVFKDKTSKNSRVFAKIMGLFNIDFRKILTILRVIQ